MEKYKKKLQESADLRQRLKVPFQSSPVVKYSYKYLIGSGKAKC